MSSPSNQQSSEHKSNISRTSIVKSDITKIFLEQHFRNRLQESRESRQRRQNFKDSINKGGFDQNKKLELESEFNKHEVQLKRAKRRVFRISQFEKIKLIGQGAFGDVYLVRDKEDNHIYAMKILFKNQLVSKGQVLNTLAERDILTQSNPWSVQLFYSFQDNKRLYLVMEFLQGGDLMGLLIKDGYITEDSTRFIIAETLMAIHNVHLAGFIHRDIKPDNLLITRDGHIRLTDYGLSTKLNRYSDPLLGLIDELTDIQNNGESEFTRSSNSERRSHTRREQICSTVGTPDYIAPEVLLRSPYTTTVDFWSLGAIMYEMLFGAPPFLDETPRGTALKIVRWRQTLEFPSEPPISDVAIDLISRLLCNENDRLDFDGIKNHPFFDGIDWANLQNMKSPIVPEVQDELDTSNFDEFQPRDADEDFDEYDDAKNDDVAKLAFMGFTYNKMAHPQSPTFHVDSDAQNDKQ